MAKFERGLLARAAASVDRIQTFFTFREPAEIEGFDPSNDGNSRVVFHFRDSGEIVPVQFPNGEIDEMNEATLVHQYDKNGDLVERKRVKDKPQGFEVYNSSIIESAEALVRGIEADRKFYRK